MSEEPASYGSNQLATIEERVAKAASLTQAEFRACNVADLRELLELAKAKYREKLDKIHPNSIAVHMAILIDKIEQLEGGSKPAHIGQQINVQINGADLSREGLVERLAASVSSRSTSTRSTLRAAATDAPSVSLPGCAANATPLATPNKRGRGRPKGSRNRPKVEALEVVDHQHPGGGGQTPGARV